MKNNFAQFLLEGITFVINKITSFVTIVSLTFVNTGCVITNSVLEDGKKDYSVKSYVEARVNSEYLRLIIYRRILTGKTEELSGETFMVEIPLSDLKKDSIELRYQVLSSMGDKGDDFQEVKIKPLNTITQQKCDEPPKNKKLLIEDNDDQHVNFLLCIPENTYRTISSEEFSEQETESWVYAIIPFTLISDMVVIAIAIPIAFIVGVVTIASLPFQD